MIEAYKQQLVPTSDLTTKIGCTASQQKGHKYSFIVFTTNYIETKSIWTLPENNFTRHSVQLKHQKQLNIQNQQKLNNKIQTQKQMLTIAMQGLKTRRLSLPRYWAKAEMHNLFGSRVAVYYF